MSVDGSGTRLFADPPFFKVPEEKLPSYLNPDVDYEPIRQAISSGELKAEVIDNFLSPDALEQLRKFCLESTVWRHPYKFGYVGAFPQDGFASISLFAVAEELRAALGEAFDGYQLAQWWAFEYDARLPGTDIHGDDADFSLNFWITPDSANLDPSTGGLVVWDKTAPSDWTLRRLQLRRRTGQAVPPGCQRRIDDHSLSREPGSFLRGTSLSSHRRLHIRARIRKSATQCDPVVSPPQGLRRPSQPVVAVTRDAINH